MLDLAFLVFEALSTPVPDVSAGALDSIFAGLQIGQVTFTTVGVICVLALLGGKLITLREHKETRSDRDTWRESSLKKDETIATLARQLEVSERGRELGVSLMAKLDEIAESRQAKGGDQK